ncbi:MAG: DUF4446 family protein [Nitriliruptoraceae bacterium]
MTLDPDLVAVLAVVATVVSALLLVAVVVLALRLRVVRRSQVRAFGGVERDLLDVLGEQGGSIAGLTAALGALEARTSELRERMRADVSRVAVTRYDAFDDMGGALSFSAALLDEDGNGLVLSAINGRSETRAYAKPVSAARSEHTLSAEEEEVIDAAMAGRAPGPPAQKRRRRRAS